MTFYIDKKWNKNKNIKIKDSVYKKMNIIIINIYYYNHNTNLLIEI